MIRFSRDALAAMVVIASAFAATPAPARELAREPSTYSVVVRHADAHPATRHAARVLLDRLGEAAMEACGASSFSLREVKAGTTESACWRDSMADAVARIGDPVLADLHARRERRLQRSVARAAWPDGPRSAKGEAPVAPSRSFVRE